MDESNLQESNPTHATYTIGLRPPSYVTDPSSTDFADVIADITIGGKPVTLSGKADGLVSFDATDIKPGESVDISVTVKSGYEYVLKSILMGTKELKVENDGKYNFTATFAAPEDKNVAFTIVVVKRAVAKVYIANSPVTPGVTLILQNAQKYTYDKQKHGLEYTTDPSGLSLDILYKSSSLIGDQYYTTDVPVAAGKYNVKISRKADAYITIPETRITDTSNGEAIIIEPAAIAITTPPTVTAENDSQADRYKFVLQGGVANALGEDVTSEGTFEVLDESTLTDINDPGAVEKATPYTDNLVPATINNTYLNVAVRFKMNNNPNYYPAATRVRVLIGEATDTKHKIVVNSHIVTVDGQPSSINTVQAEIYNGATRVGYGKNTKTEVSLGDDMTVRFRAIVDGYSKVDFIDMDPASTTPLVTTTLVKGTTNVFETGDITLDKDYAFSIALSGKLEQVFNVESFDRKEVTYNGEPQIYDSDPKVNGLKIYKKGLEFNYTRLLQENPIYYKDETGKVVTGGAPIDAGVYDVCIDIPIKVDPDDSYAAQTLTAFQAMRILKKVPQVIWPTGVSTIHVGQYLSDVQLTSDGSAEVEGTFAWEDGTIIPEAGQFYTIKFIPADTKNYEEVSLSAEKQKADSKYENMAITLNLTPIVVIDENISNGRLIVESGNTKYSNGDEVANSTTLTITPVADNGFVCKTLTIDEAGNKYTSTGETTYQINGKSIYITAEFMVEPTVEPDPDPVDPDPPYVPPVPIYYSVYLPQVEGASTDPGPGEYEVESWSTFRFYLTIDSAYSDSQPVVTTDRGETLVPRSSDGAYLVKYVRTDVEVFIDGLVQNPPPIANEAIAPAAALAPQIWSEGSMLCIRMPEALPSTPIAIYTIDGRLYASFASTPGLNRWQLPTGIYIVRVGDTVRKVRVRQ